MSTLDRPESFATPITIAIVADTHFGQKPAKLPGELIAALRESDLILHAGDFCSVEAYELISSYGVLRAVAGNNDCPALQRRLPRIQRFRFGEFTAAMIHGHGYGRLTARQAAEQQFRGTVDIAVFGHSHQPLCDWQAGTLLFNPGSPTQRRFALHHAFGVIHIDDQIHPTIHRLSG